MAKTTWSSLLIEAFKQADDSWDEIEASTLTQEQMDAPFDDGYGGSEGVPFTIWTKKHVFFPAVYDGAEWVAWVSRNPDGKPTSHIGGE